MSKRLTFLGASLLIIAIVGTTVAPWQPWFIGRQALSLIHI